ncbi:hypothetical protein [Comamonas sp. JC664]|uniref:hypothetical protein n=1 Tax=Comamonas sp. JC664 TaxID=2801917 RepID=UPI00174E7DA1|nr:hypothetical protein [Comamonas sp. JC664]MBL0698934.1 hypothetical protein [Comamonas sp. JC664]GHG79634.1 hypothetical protein GCM10012319_31690 [Comamonas sp. KCTC 72670]
MAGGALKVGDLYIAVTASIGDALKSLQQLAKATEDAAKLIKKAAEPIGKLGAMVAAGMAGAVAAAMQSNERLRDEVGRLKELAYTLAADIGDLFLPVIRKLADFFERLVVTFQRLSPETKRTGADLAVWVAGLGLAIGTIGKLAGVVEGLAGSVGIVLKVLGGLQKSTLLASIGPTLAAVAAPAAAIAAAVAGLTLLAGSVYGAWTDTSTGLRDSVMSILSSIAGVASRVWQLLTSTFKGLADTITSIAAQSLETMAWLIREAAKKLDPFVKALPKTLQMGRLNKALDTAQKVTGKSLLKDLQDGAAYLQAKATEGAESIAEALSSLGTSVLDISKDVGKGVAEGFGKSLAGTRKMLDDLGLTGLLDSLKSMIPGLASGQANIRTPDDGSASGREKSLAQLQREESEALRREIARADDYEGSSAAEAFARYERELRQSADEAAANLEMERETREEMREAILAANEAGRDSFRTLAADMRRWMDEARAAIAAAKRELLNRVAGAAGEISNLLNVAATGFAAGGPMGAIGAVVGELLLQSEAFKTLMEMVSVVIGSVADALGAILVPLQPLVGAIFLVIDAVVTTLTPVFTVLGELVEPLVPPLVMLGQLFQGLSPLLSALAQAVMLVIAPLNLIAGPALKGLFEVLKFVATIVLYIAQALGKVWNAIIRAVQSVIRGISKAVEWLGIDALKDFANSLDRLKVDTDAMGESLAALRDTTWETAEAKARETAEVLRNTAALQKATEALSNVPAAWRVNLRRFEAQDAQEGPSNAATPTPQPPPPAPSSGGTRAPAAPGDGILRNAGGEELPDWKQPNDPRNRYSKAGLADTGDGAGTVVQVTQHITGYDIDEALEAGMRTVQRLLEKQALRRSGY